MYVTGQSRTTATAAAYATVAYNAATGAQRWAARYNGPANGDDAATSVAVSLTPGTVYVTGTSGDAYGRLPPLTGRQPGRRCPLAGESLSGDHRGSRFGGRRNATTARRIACPDRLIS